MPRRVAALLLFVAALSLVLAAAFLASLTLIRGERDEAFDVFWPVFLVPLGFLIFGLFSSLRQTNRHHVGGDSRGRY